MPIYGFAYAKIRISGGGSDDFAEMRIGYVSCFDSPRDTGVRPNPSLLHAKSLNAPQLTFAGKILADEQPLTEYNIDEKKFIVVMVTKPKTGATPKTNEEQQAEGNNKEESTTR